MRPRNEAPLILADSAMAGPRSFPCPFCPARGVPKANGAGFGTKCAGVCERWEMEGGG